VAPAKVGAKVKHGDVISLVVVDDGAAHKMVIFAMSTFWWVNAGVSVIHVI
jgi:hypothetical protein